LTTAKAAIDSRHRDGDARKHAARRVSGGASNATANALRHRGHSRANQNRQDE
jgi:hypothetical protein